ncbi:hypothetical protein SAMN05428950_1011476 [Sphingomonas sp. OV641]|uniref:O-antigen ligase family protein n=1 Tax=Sphingomonas sp. OV641 TaxID=1881068 RepID=UPI0008ABBA59|nr:O-antigen ligase family protein [Sphingomonas sp. OV641]SEJ21562.1 hypothetical protein SAMN05428950_1011476 [Sphingomonas sp. OV641]
MRTTARLLFLLGVIIAIVWPRYFYISLAGRGVSGFTLITLILLAYGLFLFVFISAWQPTLLRGLPRTIVPLTAVGAYYGWRLICDANGIDPGLSLWLTLNDIVFAASWLLIGAIFMSDAPTYRAFPYVLIISAFVATIAGLAEFATGTPFLDLVGLSTFSAADEKVLSGINAASSDANSFRIKAVFAHPIVYGQVMAMLAPLAVAFALNGSRRWRLAGVMLLPCIGIGIIICQSRSPFLVLGVALGMFFGAYTLDVRNKGRTLGFMAFTMLALVSSPFVLDRVMALTTGTNSRESGSTEIRELQMELAGSALQSRPLGGYGSGMAGQYAGVEGRNDIITVDSAYVVAAVDSGYAGVTLYTIMLVVITLHGLLLALRERQSWQRGLLASFAALIAGCALGLSVIAIDDALVLVFLSLGYFISYSGRMASRRLSKSAAARVSSIRE